MAIVQEESDDGGEGGFSPYDYYGVITGAAFCTYGFTGIKVLAKTSKNKISY
jgi:hypothetical protein